MSLRSHSRRDTTAACELGARRELACWLSGFAGGIALCTRCDACLSLVNDRPENNTDVATVMNGLRAAVPPMLQSRIRAFSDPDTLMGYYQEHKKDVWAAVMFNTTAATLPADTVYTIRVNGRCGFLHTVLPVFPA